MHFLLGKQNAHFRIDYFYIDDNASCLPPPPQKKLCITFVSNFSWALTVVPREIDDNGYAIFFLEKGGEGGWWGTRCIMTYVKMVNNYTVWVPTIDILI